MVYENGSPNFYTCPIVQHSQFASSKNSYYEQRGALATASGVYAKRHLFGSTGEMVSDVAGGSGASATTYLCDYFYITLSSTRVLAFGGSAYHGARAGLAFAYASSEFAFANANCGSRLCYFDF